MKELKLYKGKGLYQGVDGCGKFDFPQPIVRVTAGAGGESLLIFGSEKTALIDCGMPYCAKTLIYNIHAALENYEEKYGQKRTLDYILATHTHYDHIGGLSAIKAEWPDAVTCAGKYAVRVFHRKGAIEMMQKMSNAASKAYTDNPDERNVSIDFERMHVDQILHEGDRIHLGRESILVLETPGHTNCSLSYALEPQRILFLSESTGVLHRADSVESQILKSYKDARNSIKKCMAYHADRLIIPHSGIIPKSFHGDFWRMTLESMESKRKFVMKHMNYMTEEEIVKEYIETYWEEERGREQPYAAFCENSKYEIKAALEDLRADEKQPYIKKKRKISLSERFFSPTHRSRYCSRGSC